jgi:hypothetical protein
MRTLGAVHENMCEGEGKKLKRANPRTHLLWPEAVLPAAVHVTPQLKILRAEVRDDDA